MTDTELPAWIRTPGTIVAPVSLAPLRFLTVSELERHFGTSYGLLRERRPEFKRPDVPIDGYLIEGSIAFPVVRGIPILMRPEAHGPIDQNLTVDLDLPQFAEAYSQMEFYGAVSDEMIGDFVQSRPVEHLTRVESQKAEQYLLRENHWLDATYDACSQLEAYRFLAPELHGPVIQLGGKGIDAVKFLLAGAPQSWLATPVLAEAQFAMNLARHFGLQSRLRCVVAVTEELPFADQSFHAAYSGGCLHHMHTQLAIPEISRTLTSCGRFAAIDPWRAPLYGLGTRVLGKREPSVHCRPLTAERVEPMSAAFDDHSVSLHGALTRYPLLAARKLGFEISLERSRAVTELDDRLSERLSLRRFGSSVVISGLKQLAAE